MSASLPIATVGCQNLFGRKGPTTEVDRLGFLWPPATGKLPGCKVPGSQHPGSDETGRTKCIRRRDHADDGPDRNPPPNRRFGESRRQDIRA